MMSIHDMLTPKEKKVRKQWLLATLIILGTCFFGLLIDILGRRFLEISEDSLSYASITYFSTVVPLTLLIVFAYKGHGTKLITCALVMMTVSSLKAMRDRFQFLDVNFQPLDINEVIGYILLGPVFIWWYIRSIQLRKINHKIKKLKSSKTQLIEAEQSNM